MVEDSQDHPEGHVGDPQDDGHLHLEGVEEAQVVDRQAPDLGEQEGQGVTKGPPHPSHSHWPACAPPGPPAQSVTHPMRGSRAAWLRAQPGPLPQSLLAGQLWACTPSFLMYEMGRVCTGMHSMELSQGLDTKSFQQGLRTVPAWQRTLSSSGLTSLLFKWLQCGPCQAGPGLGDPERRAPTHPPAHTTPDGWPELTGSMPKG